MREVITKVYRFDELSDKAKERAIESYRDMLYRSGEGYPWWREALASLEGYCAAFGVKVVDYCVGDPSRRSGNYVKLDFDPDDETVDDGPWGDRWGLRGVRLWKYLHNQLPQVVEAANPSDPKACCPFTGYCADENCLDPIRDFLTRPYDITLAELIYRGVDSWVSAVVADIDYQYSDEGITESLEANEYEFTESGELY